VGATTAAGFDALALHWDVLTAEAKAHGKTADRGKWRLVGLCHIAETKEQAYRDVEYGIEHWFRYYLVHSVFQWLREPSPDQAVRRYWNEVEKGRSRSAVSSSF
jgi:hypothetical protein